MRNLPDPRTIKPRTEFVLEGTPYDCDVYASGLGYWGKRMHRTQIAENKFKCVVYDPRDPVKGPTRHRTTKFPQTTGRQWAVIRKDVQGMSVGETRMLRYPSNGGKHSVFALELRRDFPDRRYVISSRAGTHLHVRRCDDHD